MFNCRFWATTRVAPTGLNPVILSKIGNKMENVKRCDNCIFSTYMMGVSRPMLMCRFKGNFEGKWRQVCLDNHCRNFYPSTSFKLGLYNLRLIPLTRKKFAVVDIDDYYRLSKYQWYATNSSNTSYAVRNVERKRVFMHRVIMGAPDHLLVDHIDHDGLNNRKSNLRLCSPDENRYNILPRRRTSSKYKGVRWRKSMKKWTAVVQANKKAYNLGYFNDEIEAAKAYDMRAKRLHRQFAYLNFPLEKTKD